MGFNEKLLNRSEAFYRDEYEISMMHKASSISYYWTSYATIALAPIMALTLERKYVWLSYVVILPVLLGNIVGVNWMTKSVPRPVTQRPFKMLSVGEMIFMFAITISWVYILWYRTSQSDLGGGISMIVGAMVGMISVALLVPVISKAQRNRDIKKINAELDRDSEG